MKKIIVVEDDNDTLDIVEIMLRGAGYAVIRINREITIAEINSIKPNLVIIDFFLPGQMGNEICSQIKQNPETEHIPVILYSASNISPKVAQECKADAFIAKPFEMEHFIGVITSLAN